MRQDIALSAEYTRRSAIARLNTAWASTSPQKNSDAPASVAQVIAKAWHTNSALSLDREASAFLAGIHAYLLDAREPSADDKTLRRIFEPVYELAQSSTDSEAQL